MYRCNRIVSSYAIAIISALLTGCSDVANPTDPAVLAARHTDGGDSGGGVYTATNSPSGNAVVAFRRSSSSVLTPLGSYSTGGTGIGGTIDPLMSQYSLILNSTNDVLFVVNAGSDDVSSFSVAADASLKLISRISSGGDKPVSLAQHGSILYVLNQGSSSVTALRITGNGKLNAIQNSTRELRAGAAGASTIAVTPDGKFLIVTEVLANRFESFPIESSGKLGEPVVSLSNGAGPFGLDITSTGYPIVAEANGAPPGGAVSSYEVEFNGELGDLTESNPSQQAATCWVILTNNDGLAYVSNTMSNSIGLYLVTSTAVLTLLNPTSALTGEGSAPIDLDFSTGDNFLYVLEAGTGNISAYGFTVGTQLYPVREVNAGSGSSGMQGLAAW